MPVDTLRPYGHSGAMTRIAVPLDAAEWHALFVGVAATGDHDAFDAAVALYHQCHPSPDLDAELRALIEANDLGSAFYRPGVA
jgi:hypothetical protein